MIGALLLGILAGFLARALLPGKQSMGFLATVLLGLAGSAVGFLIFTELLGIGDNEAFDLGGLPGAVIGAMLALYAYERLTNRPAAAGADGGEDDAVLVDQADGGEGHGEALGEDPHLALDVRRREATVARRRELEAGHLGSGGRRPLVQGVDVVHVDVEEGGRMRSERARAREAVPRLADHHEAIVAENELRVGAARRSCLGKALLEAERHGQPVDRHGRVLYVGKAKNLRARLKQYFAEYEQAMETARGAIDLGHPALAGVPADELEAALVFGCGAEVVRG